MDYVIPILAIFIALSFLLKVGFYPRWGTWLTALCCALFVLLITPWVTEQSKTAIAAFFASREKMLDVSVCITLEAAILITFASTASPECVQETLHSNEASPSCSTFTPVY